VRWYFSSQEVEDAPLKAYLIIVTVSYRLSIYRDLLSGVRQFLTFEFLSTLFSVLQFLRCQNMSYLILEFKSDGTREGAEGKAETGCQSIVCCMQ